jgi:uncharacterized protein DUF1837
MIPSMDFEVIVDGTFLDLAGSSTLSPIDKKYVVSLLNDFEDGKWRSDKFHNFVWDNIAETALTFQERDVLALRPASLLTQAAKKLRLADSEEDISKGSELAEIVLYGIMKHKYKALAVVPKIFYKQNAQDNAKGADSVHIVIGPPGDFSLWFGEAKFYNSIEDARLGSIVQSIEAMLSTDKLKKENSIITNVSDIDRIEIDEALRAKIKAELSTLHSIDTLKSKINVPILLLHECAITANASDMDASYIEAVKAHHRDRAIAYFSKQIAKLSQSLHKYADIRFHLILFPVPGKAAIVDKFVSKVAAYKD